jgi:hypothetical protein
MAKYGMFDLFDKDDFGSYKIGMYRLKVSDDSERGYALIDVRDYIPAKFYVTQCLTIMNDRVRFRCGQCNKLIYVDNWNGANPAWPKYDTPVCDDCFSDNYLGRVFDVQV